MSEGRPLIWRLLEIAIAEIVGTALLMFFGCMGLVGKTLPPLQGAIVFGLVVGTIVQIFGHISGAHLNPTVTLCAVILKKINPLTAGVYGISEFVGAILGFGLLKVVTPCDVWAESAANGAVCVTAPADTLTDLEAIALEFFATAFLILTVCSVWDERNADKSDSVPLKFAGVITLLSMAVGPFTGASMNPARSLAPAVWSANFHRHWVYWVGPFLGSLVAAIFYKTIFLRKQQSSGEAAEEVPLT